MIGTDLFTLLRRHGRMRAGALAQAMGASRATLMRAVRADADRIVVLGQARRTTYAARRALRGQTAPLRLYRVDQQGDVSELGRLHLTEPPHSCAVEFLADFGWPLDDDMRDGWFDGLPYPLHDMRPQGFLGRQFAQRHAGLLQVDENPQRWSDDDVLHVLSLLGEDASGDLIVGEAACSRWLDRLGRWRAGEPPDAVAGTQVEAAYPVLATQAMGAGVPGSSAGGEFPKFTTLRHDGASAAEGAYRHVLVKFSGSDTSAGTRRWADLLVCEHLALRTLQEVLGIPAAASTPRRVQGRVFLEVERFDRHGLAGRAGLVSWATLNAALFGVAGSNWAEAARLLVDRGWLSAGDAARLHRLWIYGQLIANNDMHDGNLSFWRATGGVALAPAYDMLPMLYAPRAGVELPTREYTPRLPLPADQDAWADAARAALNFWRAAQADTRISAGFRALCEGNARHLARLAGL